MQALIFNGINNLDFAGQLIARLCCILRLIILLGKDNLESSFPVKTDHNIYHIHSSQLVWLFHDDRDFFTLQIYMQPCMTLVKH